jgi:hypothetical protein
METINLGLPTTGVNGDNQREAFRKVKSNGDESFAVLQQVGLNATNAEYLANLASVAASNAQGAANNAIVTANQALTLVENFAGSPTAWSPETALVIDGVRVVEMVQNLR